MIASKNLTRKFCRCIKKVRKTITLRKDQKIRSKGKAAAKESAAIGICTKSVLQTRGKTLKRFQCDLKKPKLQTQKPLSVSI